MDDKTEKKPGASLNDYLAAERTLLAWIRTGVALMGFGFVVARFGLFLEEIRMARGAPPPPSHGLSLWIGIALITVGVVVNLLSAWHHARLVRELDRGAPPHWRSVAENAAIALVLALVGLVMAIYLISARTSPFRNSSSNSPRLGEPTVAASRRSP